MLDQEKRKPLVSIWCMTYNHAPYIRDAIEGFLAQKTSFSFEIVIHDDASTDGTIEIIQEYEAKYPHLITTICREENIYHLPNRMDVLSETKRKFVSGKYVALCEGDDYWTDPYKLQKQVDYMEAHAECMMTVHNADRIDFSKNETYPMSPFSESGILSAEQIIMQRNGIIPSASYVLRKECMCLEGIFAKCGIGDWPTQLYALTKGYIYYFDDVMSVYRYMHTGSWTERTVTFNKNNLLHCLKMIMFLRKYNEYTDYEYHLWLEARGNRFVECIAAIYRQIGEVEYNKVCNEYRQTLHDLDKKYLSAIGALIDRIVYPNFELKESIEYCKKNAPIVVWGIGQYAEKYMKVFEKNEIGVSGFLVSKKDMKDITFMGKKVWDITDFPYSYQEVAIFVAVGFYNWSEIMLTLESLGAKNYYSPFQHKQIVEEV